jgi:O-acetylhomoserine/O-acetylserine sulfhydrylase-like pyridoxal-dependent enzyme
MTGRPPVAGSGYALQDGRWLLALAAGGNLAYENGITATAGGTKAAAFQLPAGVFLFEIDTVANAGDSVLMPAAIQGNMVAIFNNGASNLDIYGRGTDTINQSTTATAYVLTPGQCAILFCAKTGLWGANKTA